MERYVDRYGEIWEEWRFVGWIREQTCFVFLYEKFLFSYIDTIYCTFFCVKIVFDEQFLFLFIFQRDTKKKFFSIKYIKRWDIFVYVEIQKIPKEETILFFIGRFFGSFFFFPLKERFWPLKPFLRNFVYWDYENFSREEI